MKEAAPEPKADVEKEAEDEHEFVVVETPMLSKDKPAANYVADKAPVPMDPVEPEVQVAETPEPAKEEPEEVDI